MTFLNLDEELMCAFFAHDQRQAEVYRAILQGNGITVMLGEPAGAAGCRSMGSAIPVLVPESHHESANELIASFEVSQPAWGLDDDDDDNDVDDDEDDEDFDEDDDYDDDFDDDDDDDSDDLDDDDL